MMDEYIARTITNELRNTLSLSVMPQMLTLYEGFAKLDTPVETGIRAEWMDNVESFYRLSVTMRANHSYLINPESFLKKLLYVVDEQAYRDCIANPKSGLHFAMDTLGLLRAPLNGINPATCDCSKLSAPISRAIVQLCQLRNISASASREWSIHQMVSHVNTVMATTLYAVWLNRDKLQKLIGTATGNSQFGIDAQLETVVQEYERKVGAGFRYVPLLWESEDNATSKAQSKRMRLGELLEDKRILLAGDAGCGKTTSLDNLEYQAAVSYLAGDSNVIPVKIVLINEGLNLSLEEMICRKLNIPSSYCDTLLKKGAVHLLIDGLNELTTDMEHKKAFVISIEQFMERYPGIFIAASDRRYSPFPIRMDKTYHLKRMGTADILAYARTKAECDQTVNDLLSEVLCAPGFCDLEFTPLLVNQLLIALSARRTIPEDLAELVGVYLEALMTREYVEKRDPNAAPGKLDAVLMKLALEDAGEDGISLLNAMKLCAEINQEKGLRLESDKCINLAVQLGILTQNGSSIDFILDEYRTYYLLQAIERGV